MEMRDQTEEIATRLGVRQHLPFLFRLVALTKQMSRASSRLCLAALHLFIIICIYLLRLFRLFLLLDVSNEVDDRQWRVPEAKEGLCVCLCTCVCMVVYVCVCDCE